MPRPLVLVFFGGLLAPSVFSQAPDAVSAQLRANQYDLAGDGKGFLLKEAERASFFALGELHGDNETPALVRDLWPALWRAGYRHVAAEISPWKADRLQLPTVSPNEPPGFSWPLADVRFLNSLRPERPVLWGCDMEEGRPDLLIRDWASANPRHPGLQAVVERFRDGYRRALAPELLPLVRGIEGAKDVVVGGGSLRDSIVATLEIEVDRLSPDTRLSASMRREALMKSTFVARYRGTPGRPKVMARYGRNHLHRGYDRRGVSTLGNLLAELAAAENGSSFHVAEFAAGGQVWWGGRRIDADERSDDPAFALLTSLASHPATVFDVRPLRQPLHRIPEADRSPAVASLVYWCDSYDAIVCYKQATPIR